MNKAIVLLGLLLLIGVGFSAPARVHQSPINIYVTLNQSTNITSTNITQFFTGVTIPANNVTSGTFASGQFVFQNQLLVQGVFNASSLVNLSAYNNCGKLYTLGGVVTCGGDNTSAGAGITALGGSVEGIVQANPNPVTTTGNITFNSTAFNQSYDGRYLSIAGVRIPIANITNYIGWTLPFANITGYNVGGVTVPWTNITGYNVGGVTLPYGNLTGTPFIHAGFTVPFANITGYNVGGVTIPIGNVTSLLSSIQCTSTDKLRNITIGSGGLTGICDTDVTGGSGSAYPLKTPWLYNDSSFGYFNDTYANSTYDKRYANFSNLTDFTNWLNASKLSNVGMNFPFANITGYNVGGVTVPWTNITGYNVGGVTVPWTNITGYNVGGVRIPIANITDYIGWTLPIANITGVTGTTIPADNVTQGTFLGTLYFFRNNLTVQGNATFNQTVNLTLYPNCTLKTTSWGAVICGADNGTNGVTLPFANITGYNVGGVTVPAGNVTAGTFAAGNFVFPGLLTINSNLTVNNFTQFNANATFANPAWGNTTYERWLDSASNKVAVRWWNGTALVLNVSG